MPAAARLSELHLWSASLDAPGWPGAEGLPPRERERAARLLQPAKRRRWTAARWALREVLSRYLDVGPAEVALVAGGKPVLAGAQPPLRFNLSHSRGLALVVVSPSREVGIDVEWIDPRRPTAFYLAWTRREARAKCFGRGLLEPLPDRAVTVANIETSRGFAAALAIAGDVAAPVRRFALDPIAAQPGLSVA